jgi:hypothetical protein
MHEAGQRHQEIESRDVLASFVKRMDLIGRNISGEALDAIEKFGQPGLAFGQNRWKTLDDETAEIAERALRLAREVA